MATKGSDRIERRLKNISADIKRFVEKKIELFIVTAGKSYAKIASEYMHKVIGLFMLALAFVFLLIALAEFIGGLLGSQPLGYVIVSIPLIIFGYILFKLTPKSLTSKLQHKLEDDVFRLLDRYENQAEQSLNAAQIEENKKERKNDGSR